MSRCVRYFAALLLFSIGAGWPARAAEPQVWISSNDPTYGGAADFWQMFVPDAPWQSAKQHVAVFSIDQNLVTNGPPDKLRQFYAFLKQNHIALAIGIGMLTGNEQWEACRRLRR
ncbi:hypothetical protein [Bradyrhizobium sp. Gha]|uniref:hypothetical protein n=1 Tax=Bradyrhizobium sp. Gha TaxID=1855318 RepID=UPI0008EC026F|nr:hypothetical protein [Bradyrhizobium sp. Gha]SFH64278.1 hypothetical protein SAMN05216525_10126 [Bradyrhizobium sp. Gha]